MRIEESLLNIFPVLVGDTAAERQELMNYMQEQGSQVGIHYPICIEETGAYNDLASNNFNPRTRKNADRLVSLPIHPFMTPEDCLKVVKILNSWKSEKKAVEQLAHRAERV